MNYLCDLNIGYQKTNVRESFCRDCDSDDNNDNVIVDNGINRNKDYTMLLPLVFTVCKIFLHSLFHLILI